MTQDEQNEQELVFHYNRERRIRNAPESVQNYYSGESHGPQKGLIRIFFTNRGTKLLFFSIIILSAVIFAVSLLHPGTHIGGVPVSLAAFQYDGTVYVTVELAESTFQGDEAVPAAITVDALDREKSALFSGDFSGSYEGNRETFRTSFPDYDILEISAHITIGDKSKVITAAVDRN